MKKILLAAAAALAITGCSQNEEFDVQNSGNEININTGVSNATRAVLITNDNFGKFFVNAYGQTGENFDATATSTEVIKDGVFTTADKGTTWTTDGHYYWPADGHVTFFGYGGTDGITGYTAPNTTFPTFKYTVKDDVATQEDVVVAQNQKVSKGANAVGLLFKHALTQVYFKLQGNGTGLTYEVTNVTIKDALNSGTFTYGTAPETSIGGWVADATKKDYPITHTQEVIGGDAATVYGAAAQAMILMPQTLNGVTVDVTYSAKNGEVVVRKSAKESWNLSGEWVPGQKLAYVLTLSVDEIELKGSLENSTWVDKEGDTPTKP